MKTLVGSKSDFSGGGGLWFRLNPQQGGLEIVHFQPLHYKVYHTISEREQVTSRKKKGAKTETRIGESGVPRFLL